MKKVLVVSGGGFQGLGLLDALQQVSGLRPMVADVHEDNVARYRCPDCFVVPPIADEEAFVSSLFDLVASHKICAVFPATSRELPLLAKIRGDARLLGAQLAVCPAGLVAILLDKARTADFLRTNGLPHQSLVDPESHDFSVPLFGKPRTGWGGAGTVVARTREDARLHNEPRKARPLVWVPFAPEFDEYSSDFAISPSGHVSPIVLRRRILTSGGYAVISESIKDSRLASISSAAAKQLAIAGGCGIFNVQLIRPANGEPFVSDVNPRFGTSAVHGLAEGVNVAQFFIEDRASSTDMPRRPAKTVRSLETLALPRLSSRPAAVVFDLDDTLVDHKLWMAEKIVGTAAAVRDWTEEHEFVLTALQYIDEGERSHLVDRLVAHFGWTAEQHSTLLAAYRATRIPSTPLYPDVMPVLLSLREAGFQTAILTDNPPETQRAKIEGSEVLRSVSKIIYSREAGGEKPSAAAFGAAAFALSLPPNQLSMVGDNYFRDGVGAIRSGYACAFLIRRAGAFAASHMGIRRLASFARSESIHEISNLAALKEVLLSA